MKKHVFVLLLMGGITALNAQSLKTICSYACYSDAEIIAARCVSKDDATSYAGNADLNPYQIFNQVIKAIQNNPETTFDLNYLFARCNVVCTAAATIDDHSRQVIYYNPVYLSRIRGDSVQVRWAIYAIFAHEIGHEVMGHAMQDYTLLSPREKRVNELRADFFGGFVLSHMPGATEANVLAGIATLNPAKYHPAEDSDEEADDYPTLVHRREAALDGFHRSAVLSVAIFNNIQDAAMKHGISTILHTVDHDFTAGNFQEGLEKLKALQKDERVPKELVFNMQGIGHFYLKNTNLAKTLFEKAIIENPENVNLYQNKLLVEPNDKNKKLILDKIKKLK